jgi:hypothetical protein
MLNKIFPTLVVVLATACTMYSQGIYFLPDPTNVGEPARLYINTASADCQCDELQDAGPDNPIYIWTWMPSDSRPAVVVGGESFDVSNGAWEDSNENLRMTQDENNPELWYFDFLGVPPTDFYGTSPAPFYSGGISFLIKEKSGASAADEGPEQKSADLSVVPESPGCVLQFCTFPTVWFPTDYLTITYDNNQEALFALQNLNPSEAFIFYEYRVDGGPLQTYGNSDAEAIPLESIGGGFFTHTMIPNEFLPIDIEGGVITELNAVITKSIPVIQAPPFSKRLLTIGCPE